MTTSVSEREQFVAAFATGWALAAGADAFLTYFVPDWIDPDIELRQPLTRTVHGLPAFERSFRAVFTALPDLRAEVEAWTPTATGVDVHLRFFATLGRSPVEFTSLDRIELRSGRILRRSARLGLGPLLRAAVRDRRALWALVTLARAGIRH